MKLRTIDLFSGCGGLTEGFEATGLFSTIGIVEWDKASLETLTKRLKEKWGYNNPENFTLYFDMQRTDELLNGWNSDKKYGTGVGLKKVVKKNQDNVDLIIGGPPCQAYSIAGRIRDKNGMKNDYRNYLFETYLTVVKQFKPKIFVFENVLGLLSAKPDDIPITELIREGFNRIGYTITKDLRKNAVVNAADYGVPQQRKRLIIVGIKNTEVNNDPQKILFDFYHNILPKFKSEQKTVEDAIFDLPKMRIVNKKRASHEIVGKNRFLNHVPRYHNPRDIEIFKELTLDLNKKEGKYNSIENIKKLYTEKTGKKSNIHKYYVLNPYKPSNTIVAHLHKDGLRHIHPDPNQARSITVREAARLQTFPDDFEFLGTMGDQYKMIGNAVPPQLSKKIALSLNELIQKYNL